SSRWSVGRCGAASHGGVLAGRGEQGGFLDLVDRPLLVTVLDPARPAAGAGGDRVQTETDGDQGRSAQRAAWHQSTSVVLPSCGGDLRRGRRGEPGRGRSQPTPAPAPVRLTWALCPGCLRLHGLPQLPPSGRGGPGCAWAWPPRPWAPGSGARRPRTRPGSPRPSHGRGGGATGGRGRGGA